VAGTWLLGTNGVSDQGGETATAVHPRAVALAVHAEGPSAGLLPGALPGTAGGTGPGSEASLAELASLAATDGVERLAVLRRAFPDASFVSARTGAGVEALRRAVAERLRSLSTSRGAARP
jgi:hypothetical protein